MVTTVGGAAASAPEDGAAVARYAEVVVDAHTAVPDGAFTYSVPPHLDVRPGHLVRAPFGTRTLHGIVVALRNEAEVPYTKPIDSLVEGAPLLSPERVEFGRWLASYYGAPLFDALALMLPPGLRTRSQTYVKLSGGPVEAERLPPGARRLLAYLRANPRPHRLGAMVRTLGPWVQNAVRRAIEAGAVVEWLNVPTPRPHAVRRSLLVPSRPPEALRAYVEGHPRAKRQAALLRELAASAGGVDASDARRRFGPGVVRAVTDAGMARLDAGPVPAPAIPPVPSLLPTAQQQAAIAAINRSVDDASNPRVWLLHGVTGSGKTEVYLQSIAHCLAGRRRAIVLVPELALTPQALERFEARFPGRVGILHSGLAPTRQAQEWRRVFRGERDIVIGPRSALFAPVADLGLIVIDEEHEWTYKQVDPSPRYHARDAAERLGLLTGAVVVLGSATPDVTSACRAERGEIGMLALPTRIERSGAPTAAADVKVVDMREELREGNRSVFSRPLQERLRATVAAGRQAVLFLNRRGAASVVQCRNCGFAMCCPRCSTSLTHHETGGVGRLVCHHCGRTRGVPARCPRCRSDRIRYLGLGTQRLVEEVAAVVPGARVLRWDSDATASAGAHERLLKAFAGREADVLVGTQMVAKGLDVPSVDLVGVVLADVGLHLPDFRAPERIFQLLTQVAGRAGRGPAAGHVVIQTYLPDHYAIRAAAAQDYAAFYEAEMAYRRIHGNPPFQRLVRLVHVHSNRDVGHREAARFGHLLHRTVREWDMTEVDLIGPAPAYPPRVRNAWRWHLLIRAPEPRMLLDKVPIPPAWYADVDPVSVV